MNKKSSIILIINMMLISMITKIISMSSKIIISRGIGVEAVSIYSLVNPIFIFSLTIISLSLPTVISTLISKHPQRSKNIFLSSIIIATILNFIYVIFITFSHRFIAEKLLHNYKTSLCIKLLVIVVPLTTYSSIIKGYFIGKNNLILTSTSSLIEECSRLIFTIILLGFIYDYNNEIKATFTILVMCLGEIVQTSFLILSSPQKKHLLHKINLMSVSKNDYKDVISISLPLTLSRIITSFTYMLEPIILSSILLKQNFTSESFTLNYGILSSYVMPLLMLPGFFSLSIGNYLLPNLSSLISKKEYKKGENLFKKMINLSLIIGIIFSLIFYLFGDKLIYFIYKVDYGYKEIKILSIPFLIYYIETPINISMHALNQTKTAFKSSIISSVLRIIVLIVFSKYFGVLTAAISTLISCYIDVFINYLTINNIFKSYNIDVIN